MIQGRSEDALKSLARLHSRGNINDQFVQGEYQEMLSKVQEEASMEGGWALVSFFFLAFCKSMFDLELII